jgi:hypothetical protein
VKLSRWIPWRLFATRLARAYGVLDPISFLSKLRAFSRPSEVAEPLELLRAGILFHARGLINTRAIQHNLDWVWPYWVERQFNPHDRAFIPRAFSFSHINLTHRNWTSVGLPDIPYYPIVDPRGLITPIYDGWSLDLWLVMQDGRLLLPSKTEDSECEQSLSLDPNLAVCTRCWSPDRALSLEVEVDLVLLGERPNCRIRVKAAAGGAAGWLAVALRPYNPEGISFIDQIEQLDNGREWRVNRRHPIRFAREYERGILSCYNTGDVLHRLSGGPSEPKVACKVGLASAAALFPLDQVEREGLEIDAPIYNELEQRKKPTYRYVADWSSALGNLCQLEVPDERFQRLFRTAVAGMVQHCPHEVYPGPYTYKRFWFRDAAFILHGLLTVGERARVERCIETFWARQTRDGYFLSQEGEWDSNGEALWLLQRYCQISGKAPPEAWRRPIEQGARWIVRKRLPKNPQDPHGGLLPAGFSAEHLGPNDHYYWDAFWSVAGLRAAADMLDGPDLASADRWRREADDLLESSILSLGFGPDTGKAIPAAPLRRMDAGAIGSLVADYPLQLFAPGDERIVATAEWLLKESSFEGGFFQNMIHSGINPYLTLHLAQVMLRAGQPERAWPLIETVASLASPTGQWPEAIHPRTKGGCMGDGQHIWAAAEWAILATSLFVREEGASLILLSGVPKAWLRSGERLRCGPVSTAFGSIDVTVEPQAGFTKFSWQATWLGESSPPCRIQLAGTEHLEVVSLPASGSLELAPSR